MSESCCGQRPENCRACGGDLGREYHFAAMGACFCLPCWREIARTQRKGPPAQQMLTLGQGAKPQRSLAPNREPERWGDHTQEDFGVLDGGGNG